MNNDERRSSILRDMDRSQREVEHNLRRLYQCSIAAMVCAFVSAVLSIVRMFS